MIKWKFGGDEPLDGISVYDAGNYWHFVTYGLSKIDKKENDNTNLSGYGMEFTFKLKKDDRMDDEIEIIVVCNILQNIAKSTFKNDVIFAPYEYLRSNQNDGIDFKRESMLTGFITIPDSSVNTLITENGEVKFIEFLGVKDEELKLIIDKKASVKDIYSKIGSDLTDFYR